MAKECAEIGERDLAIVNPFRASAAIDECIARAKAHGSHSTLDEEFSKDLEAIVNSRREPLNPPEWD